MYTAHFWVLAGFIQRLLPYVSHILLESPSGGYPQNGFASSTNNDFPNMWFRYCSLASVPFALSFSNSYTSRQHLCYPAGDILLLMLWCVPVAAMLRKPQGTPPKGRIEITPGESLCVVMGPPYMWSPSGFLNKVMATTRGSCRFPVRTGPMYKLQRV